MSEEQEPSFEVQLANLEDIVQALDAEDLPLEKAIALYEKGVTLSFSLNKTLEEAQRKIEILTKNARGEMTAEPFGEDETHGDG